jgi:hypothetical protein
MNVLSSFSLYPSITKPTRITSKSATLIDNIFTNSRKRQTSGLITTDISDHLPIFITTDLNVYRHHNTDPIKVREMTEQNINCFKAELGKVNWDDICSSSDVNVSYSMFLDKFQHLYDKCIPMKIIKARSKKMKPKSPWITYGILKSINRKNKLYKKSIRKPTNENVECYKTFRNKLNSTLRLANKIIIVIY